MTWFTSFFWCMIGIIGGAVVGYISKNRKRLSRKICTVSLISGMASKINGLEISHNSIPIKNLYSSTIQIKNNGNTLINNSDIPAKCPLSIHTDGIFIIDEQSMQLPDINNENDIHITFETNESGLPSIATIKFDFISKKQLITFSLLHTGNISFGKWLLKEGKVLDSDEILDSTEPHPIITKQTLLVLFFPIIITIITYLITTTITNVKLENSINKLQEQNYEMQYNIKKLEEKMYLQNQIDISSESDLNF